MQRIKRKPVGKADAKKLETKTSQTKYRFEIKPDQLPVRPTDLQNTSPQKITLEEKILTPITENVDGNDLRAFVERSKKTEHQDTLDVLGPGRETTSTGPAAYQKFNNNSCEGSGKMENSLVTKPMEVLSKEPSSGMESNVTASGMESNVTAGHGRFSNNINKQDGGSGETTGHCSIPNIQIEHTVTSYIDYRYEEAEIDLELSKGRVQATGFIPSKATLSKVLEEHKTLFSKTGSYADSITSTSVGPVSRMLHSWYQHHIEVDPESFSEYLPLDLNKILSHGRTNYGIRTPLRPEDKMWMYLYGCSQWSYTICGGIFSRVSCEELLTRWAQLEPTPNMRPKYGRDAYSTDDLKYLIDLILDALDLELTHGLSKAWPIKAAILVENTMLDEAEDTLEFAMLTSTVDDCNTTRNIVNAEYYRYYLYLHVKNQLEKKKKPLKERNLDEEAGPVTEFFFDINWRFNSLRRFERALDRIEQYTWLQKAERFAEIRLDPTIAKLVNRRRMRKIVSLNIDLVASYDFDVRIEAQKRPDDYAKLIAMRTQATQTSDYGKAIMEVDGFLFRFYPGLEEIKRWLCVKAYLLAVMKLLDQSLILQIYLEKEPLDVNDGCRAIQYVAHAISKFQEEDYSATEIACYKALQYSELQGYHRNEVFYLLNQVMLERQLTKEAGDYVKRIQPTESFLQIEKKMSYGASVSILESNGITIEKGGFLKGSMAIFIKAIVKALDEYELAIALYSVNIEWTKQFPRSWRTYKPIPFYAIRNRADILEMIFRTDQKSSVRDHAFTSARIAQPIFHNAFLHAAGDSVRFFINNVPGLDINATYNNGWAGGSGYIIHEFLGRPPAGSDFQRPYYEQRLATGLEIKRKLTTAKLNAFFTALEGLNIDLKRRHNKRSTLDIAFWNLENCWQRILNNDQLESADLIQHDVIVAYYCTSWLMKMGLKPRDARKKTLFNGVGDSFPKIQKYPEFGGDIAPHDGFFNGVRITEDLESEKRIEIMDPMAHPWPRDTPNNYSDSETSLHHQSHSENSEEESSEYLEKPAELQRTRLERPSSRADQIDKEEVPRIEPSKNITEHSVIQTQPKKGIFKRLLSNVGPRSPKFQESVFAASAFASLTSPSTKQSYETAEISSST